MPELPEVETIRRQLEPALRGRRIESAEVLDERWTRPEPPREVERVLAGRAIERVERRGKYLLLRLEGGIALAMHLRMTGNLLIDEADGGPDPPYLRAVIRLEGGGRVLFTDARRFGHAVILDREAFDAYFAARLGIEPLSESLTAGELCRLASGRRDEALHRAALHPLSPAGSMKPEDCERLRDGIVATLEAGLRSGGASVDDYLDARGERGAMQDEFLVHTREGEPCPRCGEEIRRIVVAGRSTYFCPSCQRRLRRRPRRRAPRRSAP